MQSYHAAPTKKQKRTNSERQEQNKEEEEEEEEEVTKSYELSSKQRRRKRRRENEKKKAAIAKEVKKLVDGMIAEIVINEKGADKDVPKKPKNRKSKAAKKRRNQINKLRRRQRKIQIWKSKFQIPERSTRMIVEPGTTRKSGRTSGEVLKARKISENNEKIRRNEELGLEDGNCPIKNRTVKTTKTFLKGEFVCVYSGTLLLDATKVKKKKEIYNKQPKKYGSFVFKGTYQHRPFWIDATSEKRWGETKGRLINHSKLHPNLKPEIWGVDDRPYLVFFANKDISENTELAWDYGDRSKQSVMENPWLAF